MLNINLDISQVEAGLGRLLANARDTRPMMRGIAAELLSLTEDNFENESWGNEKWPQSRRAAENGGKTLQKSGQLAASIESRAGNGYARIGSNKVYAAIHHLGGKAGRNKKVHIPARPYLPMNSDGKLQHRAEENILQVALDALTRGL